MEYTVVQILGMAFVSIIVVCIGWSIIEYIFGTVTKPKNRLEENLKNFDKRKNGI